MEQYREMKMKLIFRAIAVLFLLFLLSNEVKCDCDSLLDCLNSFIVDETNNNDSDLKVLNIEEKPLENITSDLHFHENFNIFKQSYNFFDLIKNTIHFNKNPNAITVNNAVVITNWNVSYNNDEIFEEKSLKNNSFFVDQTLNVSKKYPHELNFSLNNYLSKNHQKSLTKGVNFHELADNFNGDYDDVIVEDNITDYSVIDYVALYEDTTNEPIYAPKKDNQALKLKKIKQEKETIFTTTMSNIMPDFELSTDESLLNNRPGQSIYEFRLSESSLNEVLDDYYNNYDDDAFTDYPIIDYIAFYKDTSDEFVETTTTENPEIEVTTDGFKFLGLAEEAVNLCKTRSSLIMDHIVGLPLEQENYWDGQFRSRSFKGLKKVEIVMELTSSVNVTTESDNVVTTRLNDTTYLIRGLNASGRVDFKVQALPGESFPYIKKVTLNGREICKKKRNWRPSLYGPQEQAVLSPFESPHETGPYYCGRGQIDFTPLVVKGAPTKEGDYPWHVALFIRNVETRNWEYACGGTVLYRKTVITAAHCVVGKDGVDVLKENILVIAGKYRLYEVDNNQKPFKVKDVIIHENYTHSGNTLVDDLALLIIEESIEYGMYIQPICQWNKLQTEREVIFQEFGTIVGWGSTENDTLAETLRAAPLRVVPDAVCVKSRPSFFKRYLTKNTFCAGNKNGTSACNGDSGGGLIFPILEQDGRPSWYLRGVVSAGVRRAGGLCDAAHYVVFTDVASYADWIEKHQKL